MKKPKPARSDSITRVCFQFVKDGAFHLLSRRMTGSITATVSAAAVNSISGVAAGSVIESAAVATTKPPDDHIQPDKPLD